jgi:hypothetical protein
MLQEKSTSVVATAARKRKFSTMKSAMLLISATMGDIK